RGLDPPCRPDTGDRSVAEAGARHHQWRRLGADGGVPMKTQSVDAVALLPGLIVAGTALVVLVADLFWAARQRWLAVPLSFAGVVAALVSAFVLSGPTPRATFCLSGGACSYVEDR